MELPFFSIIIPTLNEEKFLPQLLDSLAAQNFKDFEVIVSDGHSVDSTLSLSETYKEKLPRIVTIPHERGSLPWQRNEGAKIAKGQYFLFIDADTILLPYCLSRLYYLLTQNPQVQHFSPWYAVDGTSPQDALLTLIINATMEGGIITKRPAALGPFSGFSNKLFKQINGYDESLGWGEDSDISRRAFQAGEMLTIFRETLAIYSLRRFRKQGTLKTVRVYGLNMFQVLLTKKSPSNVPGYIMGGHLYTEEERNKSFFQLRSFQQKLNKLARDFFES